MTSHAQVVLSYSPVMFLRFGETSGTTAADSSGNGHAGTYSGDYTLGQSDPKMGDGNTAVYLKQTSGNYGTVTVPSASGLQLSTTSSDRWSIEFLINAPAAPTSSFPTVLIKGDGNTDGFLVFTTPSGGLFFKSHGSQSNIVLSSALTWTTTFHHVMITFDGATLTAYIDGASQGGGAFGPYTNTNTSAFIINNGGSSAGNFTYDELAVYPVALAAADVTALYNALGNPAGQNYTTAPADSIGITDATTTTPNELIAPADVAGVTDAVSVTQAQHLVVADVAAITDAVTHTGEMFVMIDESIGIADDGTALRGLYVYPADTIGIKDAEAVTGSISVPVRTTADADVEVLDSDLFDVARLQGIVQVSIDVTAADLEVSPERALFHIDMSGDLTHVVSLAYEMDVTIDAANAHVLVVRRLTDIVSVDVVGVVERMLLANGPIYSDPSGQAAAVGHWLAAASVGTAVVGMTAVAGDDGSMSVLGPSEQPVWRLTRNEDVSYGWGAYIAAIPSDDLPQGSSLAVNVWTRASQAATVSIDCINDAASDRIAGPWTFVLPDTEWHQWSMTFTIDADWDVTQHRLRIGLPSDISWIEWSDATLQVVTAPQVRWRPMVEIESEPELESAIPRYGRVFTVLR